MELQKQFDQAAEDVKTLSRKPPNDVLLQLYSLHKQASLGDVNIDPPGNPFDFVARAKHDAWSSQKGKTKEAAMQEYIDLVNRLKEGV
jgi:acyl-CoA-binding protein